VSPVAASFAVTPGEPDRLDRILTSRYPAIGRRRWSRAIADRQVRVDGRVARKGDRVAPGARIDVLVMPALGQDLAPVPSAESPLVVLHEEERLVVVAKPPGLASHPLVANETGTLANLLVARYPECADAAIDAREGGLVHRLDRGTSGVIMAARDRAMWLALRQAFHERRVHKTYLALVTGATGGGHIEQPLAVRGRRAVVAGYGEPGALDAETEWTRLDQADGLTLVQVSAETGRLHQVRAHLAWAGFPLIGDALYGGPEIIEGPGGPIVISMPWLHAHRLAFDHPDGGRREIAAPLPIDRAALVALFGLASPDG